MKITIPFFGRKLHINIFIIFFIFIIGFLLFTHTVIPCINMSKMYEGLATMASKDVNGHVNPFKKAIKMQKMKDASGNIIETAKEAVNTATEAAKNAKEGFNSMMDYTISDSPSEYKLGDYTPIDTSKWFMPNLVVTPGQPLTPAVQKFLDRPQQPVPLPEGELLVFANTKFTPEACPGFYSNSMGCPEMTAQQYNYIGPLRGGNNVPYSEY